MKPVPSPSPPPVVGVRAGLAAKWRAARSPYSQWKADRLDGGEAIVLQGWHLAEWRPDGVGPYQSVRVEVDGTLTPVRLVIEVCRRRGHDGVLVDVRSVIDYRPVGADGDTTDIVIRGSP